MHDCLSGGLSAKICQLYSDKRDKGSKLTFNIYRFEQNELNKISNNWRIMKISASVLQKVMKLRIVLRFIMQNLKCNY